MLERFVAPFLEFLRSRRYARPTIHYCQVSVMEFALYMTGRVREGEVLTPAHFSGFVEARVRLFVAMRGREAPTQYRRRIVYVLREFFTYLRTQGLRTSVAFGGRARAALPPEHERLLGDFEEHLSKNLGFARSTVAIYRDHAWYLCRFAADKGIASWKHFTPDSLYAFARGKVRALGHLSLGNVVSALKHFFGFLRLRGVLALDPSGWLTSRRVYRMGHVPKTVTLADLKLLFRDVRGSSMSDLRDRVVLLLMTLYGMRIGDVARLKMEDVRWREGRIAVLQQKTGKPLSLPLHPVVGRALTEYVERGRPRGTSHREILLTRRRSMPYPNGSSLAQTLAKRIRRLGLRTHPHAFRHAFASRLLNNGCPPAWVQTLLGHKDPRATEIYAKVDLARLAEAADNDAGDL